MGCCGKIGSIVQGYANLISGRQYTFSARRRMVCFKCGHGRTVWASKFCTKCKCFIEPKIRARTKTCNKWEL